jgi:hypothetical protein
VLFHSNYKTVFSLPRKQTANAVFGLKYSNLNTFLLQYLEVLLVHYRSMSGAFKVGYCSSRNTQARNERVSQKLRSKCTAPGTFTCTPRTNSISPTTFQSCFTTIKGYPLSYFETFFSLLLTILSNKKKTR